MYQNIYVCMYIPFIRVYIDLINVINIGNVYMFCVFELKRMYVLVCSIGDQLCGLSSLLLLSHDYMMVGGGRVGDVVFNGSCLRFV